MQYTVYIPEIWYHAVQVEATDEGDAITKAKAGTYVDLDNTEYSHQLDDGEPVVPHWEVEPNFDSDDPSF